MKTMQEKKKWFAHGKVIAMHGQPQQAILHYKW